MTILTALVAFVVTMIVLSTMVTALVQILHRISGLRQRHLRLLMETYFDEVISPRFSAAMAHDSTPKAEAEQGVLQRLFTVILKLNDHWPTDNDGKPKRPGLRLFVYILLPAALLYLLALISFEAAIVVLFVIGALVPALRARIRRQAGAESDPNGTRSRFVQDMVEIMGKERGQSGSMEKISAVEFASRLARTGVGRAVAEKGADRLEALVNDLLRRFDSLGLGATSTFAVISRRWSIIFAFAVAFTANVDAITLLRHFVDNPAVAERVAAMGPEAAEKYQAAIKALETDLEEARKEAESKDPQTTEERKQQAKEDIERLKELIATTRRAQEQQVAALAAAGVPIGWSYFPFCNGGQPNTAAEDPAPGAGNASDVVLRDPRCKLKTYESLMQEAKSGGDSQGGVLAWIKAGLESDKPCDQTYFHPICTGINYIEQADAWVYPRVWTDPGVFLGWLFGVILAGALVGLGGPFWFDIYHRLSAVAQMVRGLGFGKKGKTESEAEKTEKTPETAHQPESAVNAFREIVEAEQAWQSAPTRARRLLQADGTPLP